MKHVDSAQYAIEPLVNYGICWKKKLLTNLRGTLEVGCFDFLESSTTRQVLFTTVCEL